MKTFWIATSLCVLSTTALAQSASRSVLGLDTCFKLVRVAELNCSTPADDAVQRRECLQNARKVQLECLELAGAQAAAPVDRPMATAEAASSDKPVGAASPDKPVEATASDRLAKAVEPTLPANPSEKAVEPEKAIEAKPAVSVSGSTPVPPVAQAPAAQTSRWTVSETSSPVDYSPLVTATFVPPAEGGAAPMELVVRCRGRRGELGLRMEVAPRASRSREVAIAYQIGDQPAVKSRWTASADGKSVNYKGDATALLQSFAEDARLKIAVVDGSGRDSEAAFRLAGWNAVRDRIATACMWSSAASKSSERR